MYRYYRLKNYEIRKCANILTCQLITLTYFKRLLLVIIISTNHNHYQAITNALIKITLMVSTVGTW